MELDKNLEMYVNDLETQEIFGKWAEKIAEDKGKEQKTLDIAKNLLKLNIPIDKITEATGLSLEEIKSLK